MYAGLVELPVNLLQISRTLTVHDRANGSQQEQWHDSGSALLHELLSLSPPYVGSASAPRPYVRRCLSCRNHCNHSHDAPGRTLDDRDSGNRDHLLSSGSAHFSAYIHTYVCRRQFRMSRQALFKFLNDSIAAGVAVCASSRTDSQERCVSPGTEHVMCPMWRRQEKLRCAHFAPNEH